MEITGNTTVNIALLLLVLSTAAQWVGIILTNKRLKARDEMDKKVSSAPACAAAASMVAEHIHVLATHTAELAAMKDMIGSIGESFKDGFLSVHKRLDFIQQLLVNEVKK